MSRGRAPEVRATCDIPDPCSQVLLHPRCGLPWVPAWRHVARRGSVQVHVLSSVFPVIEAPPTDRVLIVVTESFNPYREWLGLETDASPLSHYQLLDLPLFEDDVTKIHAAADRALARVRAHRPGAQAQKWARLLDDLAQAKACLGDLARKSVYDQSLRERLTSASENPGQEDVENVAALPEVAFVNRLPDLYPPGMAPPAPTGQASHNSVDRGSLPGTSTTPLPTAVPSKHSPANTGASTASAPAAQPTKKKKPRPVPPAPPTPQPPGAQVTVPHSDGDSSPDASSLGDVPEPVPPAPMNAHVAPPRRQRPSQWPIILVIAAVLLVLTLIIMLLALRDEAGGSSSLPAFIPIPDQSRGAAVLPGENGAPGLPSEPAFDQPRRQPSAATTQSDLDAPQKLPSHRSRQLRHHRTLSNSLRAPSQITRLPASLTSLAPGNVTRTRMPGRQTTWTTTTPTRRPNRCAKNWYD